MRVLAPRGVQSGIVPRASLRPEQLSYHPLRPQETRVVDLSLLVAAYGCWSETWRQMLLEHGSDVSLTSDDFTRQTELGVLFHSSECIGLTAHRSIDLANPIYRDDSYFRKWPREALDLARRFGDRACIGSNLLVGVPWRQLTAGPSVKELLLALSVERFLRTDDGDVLLGTMRNRRGMNALAYRLGFTCLVPNVPFHSDEDRVDLVAFHRKTGARGALDEETEALIAALTTRTSP